MNALTSFVLPRLRQGFTAAGYLALSSRPHFVALAVMATFPAMVLWKLSTEVKSDSSAVLFVITLFVTGILVGLIGHVFHLMCGPSLTKGRIAFLSGILEHAGVRRKTAEPLATRLKEYASLCLVTGAVGAACSRGARTPADRLQVMRYLAAQGCPDTDDNGAGWFVVANRRELNNAMKGIARCAVELDDTQALPLVEALMEIEQLVSVEIRDPAMTGELIKTAHFMQSRAVDMLTTQQESLRVAAEPALRQRLQTLRQLVMTDGEGA